MGTTNILPFANGTSADVQTDDTYKANAPAGFVPGPAYPNQANKALRQSSAVAAAVARLATDPAQGNQATFNDGEDAASLASKLRDTINAVADTAKLQKLAQAIATFATDTNGGGQPTFDYAADPAGALATKFIQAIYNLPDVKLARITSTLFRYFISDGGNNPDSWAKFTDAQVRGLSDTQIRALATQEMFNCIMTKQKLLTNPPVNDWIYLASQPDLGTYTDLPGYVGQREYRILSNGMVEVRVGFYQGFRPKTTVLGGFLVGKLPLNLKPASLAYAIIPGTLFDTDPSTFANKQLYGVAYVMVGTGTDGVDVRVTTNMDQFTDTFKPWSVKTGLMRNPYDKPLNSADPNLLAGSVVSLYYAPRLPYPYAYYKGPAT